MTRQRCTETATWVPPSMVLILLTWRYVLVEVGVVDHRYSTGVLYFSVLEVDHLADERRTRTVDITNELTQTLLSRTSSCSNLFASMTRLSLSTILMVEECQLTHTVSEDLPVVNDAGSFRLAVGLNLSNT